MKILYRTAGGKVAPPSLKRIWMPAAGSMSVASRGLIHLSSSFGSDACLQQQQDSSCCLRPGQSSVGRCRHADSGAALLQAQAVPCFVFSRAEDMSKISITASYQPS